MRKISKAKSVRKSGSGAEHTRNAILAAARVAFAAAGYSKTGLRQIASAVNVDPALLIHYYGSKKALFVACLEPYLSADPFLQGAKKHFGRDVLAFVSGAYAPEGDPLLMLIRSSGDPEVGAILTEVLQRKFIIPLAGWIGPPNARSRAELITALVTGIWTYRYLIPLDTLSKRIPPFSAERLQSMLQSLVDGDH